MKVRTMEGHQSALKLFLRFAAGAMLFVWVAAVTACSTHCLDSHSESAEAMHAAAPNGQSHDSDRHDDDSLCVSLHSLCPVSQGTVLVKPDFGLAFTLHFVSTALLPAPAQLATAVPSRPPDCNRIFTPEVSLGPAFRSHAPPLAV